MTRSRASESARTVLVVLAVSVMLGGCYVGGGIWQSFGWASGARW